MLADRDLEIFPYEREQVALGGMNRHPTHGNVGILMLAPLCQRNVQRRRSLHGIIEKQLVEITHPVEQQIVGMGFLDRQILHHHRRSAASACLRTCGIL